MPRELVLHLGAPKTGTTAIQGALNRSREALFAEHGILYASSGRPAGQAGHHNLVYEIAPNLDHSGKYNPARGTWADLAEEIETRDARRTVISAELLSRRPKQVSWAVKRMGTFDVTLIVYYRRQDEYLESGYNQLARFARVPDDIASFARRRTRIIEYRKMIEDWETHLPNARIICVPFQRHVVGASVVSDFGRRVLDGYEAPEPPKAPNQRAGLKSIRAAGLVQDHCRKELGEDFRISTHAATRLRAIFSERFSEVYDFSFMSLDLAREILADAEPDNRWLAQRFPGFEPETFFTMELDEARLALAGREAEFSAEERAFIDTFATRLALETRRARAAAG